MRYGAIILGATRAACEAAREATRHGLRTLLVPAAVTASGEGVDLDPIDAIDLFRESVARAGAGERRGGELAGAWARGGPPRQGIGRIREELRAQRSARVASQLQRAGVEIDPAAGATLVASGGVRLADGTHREAPIVVIATGDRPCRPEAFGFDDRTVCDSRSILRLDRVPRALLVVGAEASGCEIACLFAGLGAAVTIVDRRSRSLRYVDRELLERLHRSMRELGIETMLDEWIEKVELRTDSGVSHAAATLSSERVEICDCVAINAGVEPNCEGLGLAAAGIDVDERGFVVVDERGRTTRSGVYAVGAVVANLSSHADAHQSRSAIRDALGLEANVGQDVPLTIRTTPEIAMVGLTEEACRRLEVPHVTATIGVEDSSYWQLRNERDGLLKLVANRETGAILGVQVMGAEARELIQLGVWLMTHGGTLGQLADAIFTTPSASEAYWHAAIRALERSGGSGGCEAPVPSLRSYSPLADRSRLPPRFEA